MRIKSNFEEMVRTLQDDYGWKFKLSISDKNKRLYRKELNELKKQYERAKNKLENERDELKRNLNSNIWVSEKDRNEVLYRHETKIKLLHEIENELKSIENTLSKKESGNPK